MLNVIDWIEQINGSLKTLMEEITEFANRSLRGRLLKVEPYLPEDGGRLTGVGDDD